MSENRIYIFTACEKRDILEKSKNVNKYIWYIMKINNIKNKQALIKLILYK